MISRLYCGVIWFADSGHGKEKIINKKRSIAHDAFAWLWADFT
jgi:hypothetical protein